MQIYRIPLFTLLTAACFSSAKAVEGAPADTLMQYADFNYLHNIEADALNPAALSGVPIDELAKMSIGYGMGNGALHRIDDTGHPSGLAVDAYGIKRLKRSVFEGRVSYFNENSRQRCWNSSLFLNPLNPFVLADDQPSDFNTERFRVYGKFAFFLTPKLRFGIAADYTPGVMSDEKDPRVETKGMRFKLYPGVNWSVSSRLSIGAAAGINLLNESSVYTSLGTAVNFRFYLMSGLGTFYPQSGSSYTRDSKGTSWFASADCRYIFSERVEDRLSLTFSRDNEHSTDGGNSYQFKSGAFTNDAFKLHNRLSIASGIFFHNVELRLESNAVKGRWFDQKPVTINGSTHYEVMSSSIKHKASLYRVEAAYRIDRMERSGVPGFSAGGRLIFESSDAKNYPELYLRKYTRLGVGANAAKYFQIKRLRLGACLDAGWSWSPFSECDFNGLELEQNYSLPLYQFLTSSVLSLKADVNAHLPLGAFILGMNVGAGSDYCLKSLSEVYNNHSFNTFHCELSLFF